MPLTGFAKCRRISMGYCVTRSKHKAYDKVCQRRRKLHFSAVCKVFVAERPVITLHETKPHCTFGTAASCALPAEQ